MKPILTTLPVTTLPVTTLPVATFPDMYADWMAVGLSMLAGELPTGPAMEPKLNGAQAAAERGRADKDVSVKPAKKPRSKSAAKKPRSKPAAKKSRSKPAAKRARRAAPAKKRRASGKRR
jgi:septal ring-binding cell division protein DamX